MRLYYSPGACSLAPHIVAHEAGIPVELVRVDLPTKVTETGKDFRALNPKGAVPTLEIEDGTVLTEAAVISQFLADQVPTAGLLPPSGSLERYRALEWLNFVATELHKGFGPLWRKETPDEFRAIVKRTLATRFDYLELHLTGRDYLLGERFCIADAYAFTVMSWATVVGIDLAEWPSLSAYVKRIGARPNVLAALAAEGLLTAA